jgi:hypothetical protein
MATVNVQSQRSITTAGAQVNGVPVRASGFPVTVQVVTPAALGRIEQSMDGVNWIVATHQNGTDVTTMDDGIFTLDDLTEWVRPATVTDGSAPRTVDFLFSIYKES